MEKQRGLLGEEDEGSDEAGAVETGVRGEREWAESSTF